MKTQVCVVVVAVGNFSAFPFCNKKFITDGVGGGRVCAGKVPLESGFKF